MYILAKPQKGVSSKPLCIYVLDAATSTGILKAKQKLGVTFNSDKLGGIDFTKFSKLSILFSERTQQKGFQHFTTFLMFR